VAQKQQQQQQNARLQVNQLPAGAPQGQTVYSARLQQHILESV
jgi:hypothetical protein